MVWPSGMMASVPNRGSDRHENDAGHSRDPLGALVGSGPSKVGINGAMRARDVCRPTAEDLAAAERAVVIKHAAPRGETRPLPHGIAPSPLPAERREARGGDGRAGKDGDVRAGKDGDVRAGKDAVPPRRGRPKPGPPQR